MIFHENKLTAQEFIPLIEEAGWGSEGFYEKFGFIRQEEEYFEDGIYHLLMKIVSANYQRHCENKESCL